MENKIEKSEVIFLYESKYSIPNGDPFTGEQRYDEETKKILVSDVRIKRNIRNYLEKQGKQIFVTDKTELGLATAKDMLIYLAKKSKLHNVPDILKYCIDVRLFGGISTLKHDEAKLDNISYSISENIIQKLPNVNENIIEKLKKIEGKIFTEKEVFINEVKALLEEEDFNNLQKAIIKKAETKDKIALANPHTNITGPVQFALLNPSLNKSNLRLHQNTTHFKSKDKNKQSSIGTTSLVPYAMCQIQGWINPYVAENSGLKNDDLDLMFKALWHSTNGSEYTRTKSNQHAILLLQIVYNKPNDKVYGTDRLIKLVTEKQEEEIRNMQDDFTLNFDKLFEISKSDKIKEIHYFTEIKEIKEQLTSVKKFKELSL